MRLSYIVARMPSSSRSKLSRSRTLSIVSSSNATPRSEKNSHSSGISTEWAAVSALIASSPSDGWQSMRMKSYSLSTGRSTRARAISRATSVTSWISAADRSMLAGSRCSPSTSVLIRMSSIVQSSPISRL